MTSSSLIWRDGWPQWRSAGEVLIEFGATGESAPEPQRNASRERSYVPTPVTPQLTGDASIGAKKNNVTDRRFMIVGTLIALSMTLICVLVYLLQR